MVSTRVNNRVKYPDWEIRLAEFINEQQQADFVIGKNDCLHFANNACKAQTGEGFMDDILATYKGGISAIRTYAQCVEDELYQDVPAELDQRLIRFDGDYPPNGAIAMSPKYTEQVVIPVCFGVVCGAYVYFMVNRGLSAHKPSDDMTYWLVA